MKNYRSIVFMAILIGVAVIRGYTCTNLLVTPGASADGSAMITYTCDGEFHPHLSITPAADYAPGDSLEIISWSGEVRGVIAQVEHTYAVVNLMNEHQLVIGETTFDGREELQNPKGLLHYWDLMELALQRAKTAREAIQIMTDLVAEYGYRSTGESFSIADPAEVWILEMIGPGEGGAGAIWVAVKIPDGMIAAHANKARIGAFPLDDPDNCRYSARVIDLAIEKGYYNPNSGEPFLFNEAYCPSTPKNQRWAEARVWSLFRRAAPSINLSAAYHRAEPGAEPYPLWIKPDQKLSLTDVFELMRDHYEGTEFDMTQGLDAGPFGCPVRWRPLFWEADSVDYSWERPISTQQTGFSFVAQVRKWLPNPIGGVLWYGVDDTYTTCYFPLFCAVSDVPKTFATGDIQKFSWDSAWWVFNFVANYANLRYAAMLPEIRAVQQELENGFLENQTNVEDSALVLLEQAPASAIQYLTEYSVAAGEQVTRRWIELAGHLLTKFNDGYIKNEAGEPEGIGYPEWWLKKVVGDRPGQFRLKKVPVEGESKLVD